MLLSFFMGNHLRAAGRYLPYGITVVLYRAVQVDVTSRAPPSPQPFTFPEGIEG